MLENETNARQPKGRVNMSETSLITADLTEIINMSMSKKELMELVEADIEESLDQTRKLHVARLDKSQEKLKVVRQKKTDMMMKCMKRDADEFNKIASGLAQSTGVDFAHTISVSATTMNYTKRNDRSPESIGSIELTLSSNVIHNDTIGKKRLNISVRNSASKSMTSSELKRYVTLLNEEDDVNSEIRAIQADIKSNDDNQKALASRLRKVSAQLTRRALKSTAKGKSILKMLDDLRTGKSLTKR